MFNIKAYTDRVNALKAKRANPPSCTCSGPNVRELTKQDICNLISPCNDGKAHHVVWVCWNGHVNITALARGQGPTSVDDKPEMKFRLETFCQGNGYMGSKAAADDSWVLQLRDWICRAWEDDATGYLDS